MALLAGIMMLSGCAKNDFIYDNVITGRVGPQVFWTIGSSAVRHGGYMDFTAQYYTTAPGAVIDRVEVWYDVVLIEHTTVTSRHTTATGGFTRFANITTPTDMRISQLIHSIPHDLSSPNISLHERSDEVFVMEEVFPVSSTLFPFTWEPVTFNAADSAEMRRLFGDTFMEDFKLRMRNEMRLPDFQRMLVTNLQMMEQEEFNNLRDSVQRVPQYRLNPDGTMWINPETGLPELDWSDRDNIIWLFPGNTVVNGVVQIPVNLPARIEEVFNEVTFQQLVNQADGEAYNVSYRREFQINAHLRIFDNRGVYSSTRVLQIAVQ